MREANDRKKKSCASHTRDCRDSADTLLAGINCDVPSSTDCELPNELELSNELELPNELELCESKQELSNSNTLPCTWSYRALMSINGKLSTVNEVQWYSR